MVANSGEKTRRSKFLNLQPRQNIGLNISIDRVTKRPQASPAGRQAAANIYQLSQILSAMQQIKKNRKLRI